MPKCPWPPPALTGDAKTPANAQSAARRSSPRLMFISLRLPWWRHRVPRPLNARLNSVQLEALMDPWISHEIERDAGLRHVADHEPEIAQRFGIEAEATEIVRENERAAGREPLAAERQQPDVVALHVEIVGALGIRERRRIDEHDVVKVAP